MPIFLPSLIKYMILIVIVVKKINIYILGIGIELKKPQFSIPLSKRLVHIFSVLVYLNRELKWEATLSRGIAWCLVGCFSHNHNISQHYKYWSCYTQHIIKFLKSNVLKYKSKWYYTWLMISHVWIIMFVNKTSWVHH